MRLFPLGSLLPYLDVTTPSKVTTSSYGVQYSTCDWVSLWSRRRRHQLRLQLHEFVWIPISTVWHGRGHGNSPVVTGYIFCILTLLSTYTPVGTGMLKQERVKEEPRLEVPAPPPPPRPLAGPALALGAQLHQIPWGSGRPDGPNPDYLPTLVGFWHYRTAAELAALVGTPTKLDFMHIARILETSLGETLTGEERCEKCSREGRAECSRYTEEGIRVIKRPGLACSWCRKHETSGGCSFVRGASKWKRDPKVNLPAPARIPSPRSLAPRPGADEVAGDP